MTSDTVVSLLNRPKFVGGYIHIPIFAICFFAAMFSRTLGFTWLALMIVIAELMIVITRFVFSYEQPFMADLVRYWYAALFLFASAYTLYDEGHVRVDIAYAGLSSQTKGLLNAIGSIILGVSTSLSIVVISFNGKFSIINKPLMSFEVSQTGTVGMFIKYQLALFLGIFGVTMVIQFVSYFFESVADYRNYAGKRSVVASGSH
jgi:TRAP-type mannitol/chloroaromatic compound transport system permease small subunit